MNNVRDHQANENSVREELAAQYSALYKGQASVPLSHWGVALVSGADAVAFLQKFCTNDVLRLAPGQGCEAFFTDVKGRIVAHGAVLREQAQLRVLLPAGNVDALIAHLDRYVIREAVAFANRVGQQHSFLVPPSATRKNALAWELPQNAGQNAWDHWRFPADAGWDADAFALRGDFLWSGAVIVGVDDIASMEGRLQAAGMAGGSDDLFDALRIEAGWPLWGVDFDATHLPQEVDRDSQAISFHKGCYLGQETVARLDALGHVNRQLRRVQFACDQLPLPGAQLLARGEAAGVVTSACWSPKANAPVAWAMLRRAALAEGTELATNVGVGRVMPRSQ